MPKKFSQKEKQQRGEKGEAIITASLNSQGLWNHKLVNAGYGTIFDKLVIPPGGGYGIEIKTRLSPRIEYSKITLNERRGLDRFMKLVGREHALIIGIWKTDDFQRAFIIPWYQVRDSVLSGLRGSINMLEFPELPQASKGWDFKLFFRRRGDEKHSDRSE